MITEKKRKRREGEGNEARKGGDENNRPMLKENRKRKGENNEVREGRMMRRRRR
jgi:hypothetical protein